MSERSFQGSNEDLTKQAKQALAFGVLTPFKVALLDLRYRPIPMMIRPGKVKCV